MSNTKSADFRKAVKNTASLAAIYHDIQKELNEVEDFLKRFSDSPNKLVSEINSYIFEKKGKRIRPALLLLCAKLFGYSGDEHVLMCSLVEALHTASLIHDDIIDNSDLRRGKETVHSRWGPNVTVLLGDYVYIKTIGYSLQSNHPQIVQILTDTSAEMIEGELFEYSMCGNLDIREEEYLDTIYKKTAALFSASCRIGGILGGASVDQQDALAEYGMNFGMTFQIIDDLLDYTGEEDKLGKPVLSDLSEGRITLPLIFAVSNDGTSKDEITRLMQNKQEDRNFRQKILSIVKSDRGLEYAFQKAEEYAEKAKKIVARYPDSTPRQALSLLSDYILIRNM